MTPTKNPEKAVKPISPADIAKAKNNAIPDVVLEVFNELIALNFTNGRARVQQVEVLNRLEGAGMSRAEVLAANYLNVEEVYTAAGWKVQYIKPGFNETGETYFLFKA